MNAYVYILRHFPTMTRIQVLAASVAVATLLAGCSTLSEVRPSSATATIDPIPVPDIERPGGESAQWWYTQGASTAASKGAMQGNAKNVILFVGDGMSITTVSAARILEGQRHGRPGEEQKLSWENFPNTALSRTYNVDSQTPDSAGTMAAMATGVKTRIGVLSIAQNVAKDDCAGSLKNSVETLWESAAEAGLAVGVVTTTTVTHATPGATFSHVPNRGWENDSDLSDEVKAAGCVDIASQIVNSRFGRGPDVLMGGGRQSFFGVESEDPEYTDKVGQRLDGRDLTKEWLARHPGGIYVWNKQQFDAAPKGVPLLGLFEPSHMQYEAERSKDKAGEPSLAEMTTSAIERLKALNPNGFVLLVEGGRIDHAHHQGNAHRALVDTIALSDAVRAATQATSSDDTLILVTADHAHTMTFAGYPARGNPILGKVKGGSGESIDPTALALDATGLPYTTLGYANGPGNVGASSSQKEGVKKYPHNGREYQMNSIGRPDLTNVDTEALDYMQEALVPMSAESHGGDDVGIWAWGSGSHAVRGSVEQNTIYHFLLQANPKVRNALCAKGLCNAQGVPVKVQIIDAMRAKPATSN